MNTMSPVEEAQFLEDVEALFEEAGGPLIADQIVERVRHRELKRIVDALVEEGHATEVQPGRYTFTKTGLERLVRAA